MTLKCESNRITDFIHIPNHLPKQHCFKSSDTETYFVLSHFIVLFYLNICMTFNNLTYLHLFSFHSQLKSPYNCSPCNKLIRKLKPANVMASTWAAFLLRFCNKNPPKILARNECKTNRAYIHENRHNSSPLREYINMLKKLWAQLWIIKAKYGELNSEHGPVGSD